MSRKTDDQDPSSRFLNSGRGKTKSNAVEVPSVTLPCGGGAIKGIDEKFTVNAVNGTASFSIPLPFSPARGAAPSLSLSYNSGAGNGIFGLGWALSLPLIKRKTDKGLPRYLDGEDSDTFLFSEAEDLVPEFSKNPDGSFRVSAEGSYIIKENDSPDGGFTIRFYRPRIEGLFARIERWSSKNSPEIKWRVITKENITTLFGWSAASRISDPSEAGRIFAWLPEFTFDDRGNCSRYVYKNENGQGLDDTLPHNRNRLAGAAITYTNLYLEKVLYGNKTPYRRFNDPFPAEPDFMFQTVFDFGEYETGAPHIKSKDWDYRKDAFSDYKAGFEIRTTRLCRRVLLFHHFNELPGGSALVKSLSLQYDTGNQAGLAFLTVITSSGYIKKADGSYTCKSLPPLEFTYQKPEWDSRINNISAENLVHAPGGLDGSQYQLVDLFGEGLPGLLTEQAQGWYYKGSLGGGNFAEARPVSPKPSFSGLGGQLHLMDLDADGGKQLVSYAAHPRGFFELDEAEVWQPFRPFSQLPNIDMRDPNIRLLDLNGDGRADVLITENNVFTWYGSEGREGFAGARKTAHPFDEEAGPQLVFTDSGQTIFLADMSGDGLTDVVRIRNGEASYWPNLGYGRFGAKVAMDSAPVFDHPDKFNPSFLRLADIDGSGTTDIIYLGSNRFSCWLNLSGNAFGPMPFEIDTFPAIHNQADITVADLLGQGTTCIVWSSPLAKDAAAPLKYIDLMNGGKPHLMVAYKNNLGKEVSLEYTPSTRFYIEDKLAGKPWVTKLHFPVHCLTKTETRDTVSGCRFVSSYQYHHGYYDHAEREFRGFGLVEQTDTEHFEHWVKGDSNNIVDRELHQAPVLSKSWFHTGAFLGRDKILGQFAREYWYEEMARQGFPAANHELPLPDARLVTAPGLNAGLIDHLSAGEWREALRACKGMKLRSEVFARDAPLSGATPGQLQKELTPYAVSGHNCVIELLQPRGQNKHTVFVVKESEAVAYLYERDTGDPRIAHNLNIKLDEHGNILEEVAVAYPRLSADPSLPVEARQAQGAAIITYTQNFYTNDVSDHDRYRLRLLAESMIYELRGVAKAGPYYALSDFDNILAGAAEVDYHETDAEPSPGSVQKRLIEHTRATFYNPDLTGPLPLHELGNKGLAFENYRLAYTPELLTDIFGARTNPALLQEGGFVHSEGDAGWWVRSGAIQYIDADAGETAADALGRFYTPVAYTDPFGSKTRVGYDDSYYLFIKETEDALGNVSCVDLFNYRTLSPQRIKDANNNISEALSDELGLVKAMAVSGKGGEADDLGGLTEFTGAGEQAWLDGFFNAQSSGELVTAGKNLLQHATARFVYNFDSYQNTGKPAVAASILREEHFQKNSGSPVQISFEYSGGLGQAVLKKVQAGPGPAKTVTIGPDFTCAVTEVDTSELVPEQLRWIGSGRAVLNNKGSAVKKYEPYFSVTHQYEDLKELVENGVTPVLYYDPLGRLRKTEMPDGTFNRTEFDAWKQSVYDQNDTVLESAWYHNRINRLIDAELTAAGKDPGREKLAAGQAAGHAGTPVTRHFDPLGRPVHSVEHNKHLITGADEFYHTRAALDAEGNLRGVTDARGNLVMQYKYDMLGNRAYQNSMDAGQRWLLGDILGKPLRTWDERGHEFQYFYDLLRRPAQSKVQGGDGGSLLDHVFERIFYGEAEPEPELKNLRGKVFRRYDTGGMVETPAYDFKGLPKSTTRKLFKGYRTVADWTDANLEADLEPGSFTFVTETDALGKITRQTTPDGSVTILSYNEAGLLNSEVVEHAGSNLTTTYIKDIDYNEKGQRSKIIYGNDVITNFYYDKETFRLKRLESKRAGGGSLQDWHYTFDPAGNVTHIEDRCIPAVFFNNRKITGVSAYTYDALYRLVEASGRESNGAISFNSKDNWNDAPFLHRLNPGDPVAMRNYVQSCRYDAAGNILQMRRQAPGGDWTRDYNYQAANNRLAGARIGPNTYSYLHHPRHGFMTAMPHLEEIGWNFKEEIVKTIRQRRTDGGTPEATYYQYDGQGQRLRKITENQADAGMTPAKKDERIYLPGYEIYKKHSGGDAGLERVSLSLTDQQHRFVIIETRNDVDDGTEKHLVRYQLHNHLGSACLELDGTSEARVISYEEYHPFGTTAYQANSTAVRAAAKRYRYTGKERDEENGLYYHGARYYACWLGRWVSSDPAGPASGLNFFAYVSNNPNRYIDPSGLDELEVVSRTTTKAGTRTFYHVIDWAGYSPECPGYSAVGNQMANIQQKGIFAGGGKYGSGAYAFASEAEAQGLAGTRRPYAAFQLAPGTEVEEIILRGEGGSTTTYIRIQPQSGATSVRTASVEFRNVSVEQQATYQSAIEKEGLAAVRTTPSADARAARAAPASARPAAASKSAPASARPATTAARPAGAAARPAPAAARPTATTRSGSPGPGVFFALQVGATAYFLYRANTASTSAEKREAQNAAALSMLGPVALAVPLLMELSPYLEPVVEPAAKAMAERAVESGAKAPPRDSIGEASWWLGRFGMPTTWLMGIF